MKTHFLEIFQQYYIHPIKNKETGENCTVYFEVNDFAFEDAIELAERTLNFNFDDETIIDFASNEMYPVWNFSRLLNYHQFLDNVGENCSIILIDGTIINK